MTMPLSVDVIGSPSELAEGTLRDLNVVVIDVLRATTVIGHALAHGAERILPAGSVEQALEFRTQLEPGTALLCGERGGYRVPGFDLGNSPLEYVPQVVQDKTLILASTNGSVMLARCGSARRVLVASFNTLGAVAARMTEEGGDWTIVCSGKVGRACLEDLACAGRLAERLNVRPDLSGSDIEGDGLAVALAVYESFGDDLKTALLNTAHGRYLHSIGFADDLEVCAAIDSLDVAPELVQGRIVAERSAASSTGRRGTRRPRARAGAPDPSAL